MSKRKRYSPEYQRDLFYSVEFAIGTHGWSGFENESQVSAACSAICTLWEKVLSLVK